MQFFEEARAIWRDFVPKAGQADTVQGELLRATEKLRDEAVRNGNCNWDSGFEILLSFLGQHLLEAAVYSAEEIDRTSKILLRLQNYEQPLLDDGPYDELGDRIVQFFRHHGSRPYLKNPALLR